MCGERISRVMIYIEGISEKVFTDYPWVYTFIL